jgi:hypothetical protein
MVNAGPPRQCRRFQAQRFGFLDAFAEDEENSVIWVVIGIKTRPRIALRWNAHDYPISTPEGDNADRRGIPSMTETYLIADLHGRYDLLELGMRTIVHDTSFFHSGDSIVTLGDYVDRGPQSRQTIEYLMAMQRDLGSRLICLKGNHEDIMWQTCRKLPSHPFWDSHRRP